mgnify:CR=1 FL=1
MNINGTQFYNGKDDFMSTYIKADQFIIHMGFAAEAIWSLLMASLENMWKAYQKVRMCWIILVTALRLAS